MLGKLFERASKRCTHASRRSERVRRVWIHSGVYYPLILYLNLVLDSPRQFTHIAASYLLLLCTQIAFFLLFPVSTPAHWRAYNRPPSASIPCISVSSSSPTWSSAT